MDARLPTLPLAGVWALTTLVLAGCTPDAVDAPVDMFDQDPVVARALHDPLMIDPDLVGRGNAYSLIELSDGHPLPVFKATSEAAARARSAARFELLEGGQIPDLPAPSSGSSGFKLGQMARANAMVEAAAGPLDCNDLLEDDLIWSTRLSPATVLPPHAMVQRAAGVDQPGCGIRAVRYRTAMGQGQALEYHFTKLERAGFQITRFGAGDGAGPENGPGNGDAGTYEAQLVAQKQGERVVIAVRSGPYGMSAVDVVDTRS